MGIVDVAAEAAVLALALVSIGALAWRSAQDDDDRPRTPRPRDAGDIATPVVIDEHGDLDLYDSVAAAERSCEAVDVWNDEYVAYDARGRPLSMHVDESELVWFELEPDSLPAEDEVAELLRRYIYASRPTADLDRLALPELLQTAGTLGLVTKG